MPQPTIPDALWRLPASQTALTDDHAMRYTNQLHVGEHHPRAFVAVIEHHINPGATQIGIQLVRRRFDGFTLVIAHRHDSYRKRSNRRRQNDPALIITLLDRRADNT